MNKIFNLNNISRALLSAAALVLFAILVDVIFDDPISFSQNVVRGCIYFTVFLFLGNKNITWRQLFGKEKQG